MKMSLAVGNLVRKAFSPVLSSSVFSWIHNYGTGPKEKYPGHWQESSREACRTRSSVLANSAVYTCINNISSDISKLPLRVMRSLERGGREEFRNHPISKLLRRPNRFQTLMQFMQEYLSSKLYSGNTYILLWKDARGVVNEMYVLDPREVTPCITDDGGIYYRVGHNRLAKLEEPMYVPADYIVHDRAITMYHPLIGVSPLYAAGISAMVGNAISQNSENFFQNMSRASGVLSAPGDIPPETALRLKTEWDRNYSGGGFGKVAVLGSGLEWQPLTMNAAESQLIDQLRWTVQDVGRVYRVPGFMLGETGSVNYRSSEQLSRLYFNGCLSYHIEAIEQCLNEAFGMTSNPDVGIEFDLSPLFRMETDLRYAAHRAALNAGWKSINEVRAEEGMAPVDGGEEPRIQVQYVPLSKADGSNFTNAVPTPETQRPDETEEDSGKEDITGDDDTVDEDDPQEDESGAERSVKRGFSEDFFVVDLSALEKTNRAISEMYGV